GEAWAGPGRRLVVGQEAGVALDVPAGNVGVAVDLRGIGNGGDLTDAACVGQLVANRRVGSRVRVAMAAQRWSWRGLLMTSKPRQTAQNGSKQRHRRQCLL
ncbi:hypothetical protein B7435_33580, partial [Mycolicibacterium peregrinum]|uniref:hypothetical protein n=1 Tax=Mycolicibacterium peregrinum TaxID=43304 RepID=UPI000B73EB95